MFENSHIAPIDSANIRNSNGSLKKTENYTSYQSTANSHKSTPVLRLDSGRENQNDTSSAHKRSLETLPRDFKSKKRHRPSNSASRDAPEVPLGVESVCFDSARTPSIQALRFACPYFKYDPKEFGRRSACSGPGWESTHRVKEHVYRCHTIPIRCPRCRITLPNNAALLNHLSSDEQCERHEDSGEVTHQDGFTEDQERQLRKRARLGQSEIERWKEVYMILFPDAAEHDIPSPFYHFSSDNDAPNPAARANKLLIEQQGSHLSAVRKNIEIAVDEVLLIAAGMLRERIPEIVRASQEEITRQSSNSSTTESDGYPLTYPLSPSLVARTSLPVADQSSGLTPENQEQRPTNGFQLASDIQRGLDPSSLSNRQGNIIKPSELLDFGKSLSEGTHSPNRGTCHSYLDIGPDFMGDVDSQHWDEAFLNFDWSNST